MGGFPLEVPKFAGANCSELLVLGKVFKILERICISQKERRTSSLFSRASSEKNIGVLYGFLRSKEES